VKKGERQRKGCQRGLSSGAGALGTKRAVCGRYHPGINTLVGAYKDGIVGEKCQRRGPGSSILSNGSTPKQGRRSRRKKGLQKKKSIGPS